MILVQMTISGPGLRTLPAVARPREHSISSPAAEALIPGAPPRIVCGFPFGLWNATRPLVVGTPVLVWPQTFAVGPIPDVRVGHSDEGLSNRDRAGDWGDPPGVRRYRRGDRFRHIHWTQTAQRGELMVYEVQERRAPGLDRSRLAPGGTFRPGSEQLA